MQHIERVWRANLQVYGAKNVWRQLRREGHAVARCTAERLMHRHGLRGDIRGTVVRTTVGDPKAPCPLDKVNRRFRAEWPNQLWVADFTYVVRPEQRTKPSIGAGFQPIRAVWICRVSR